MRADTSNPSSNAIPHGMKEAALIKAITTSGYPLQGLVARRLQQDFSVVEEWDFVDDSKDEHRNLDLLAVRRLRSSESRELGSVSLLVECKRSRHPFVFFKKVTGVGPPRFPVIAGVPGGTVNVKETNGGNRGIELAPATALGIDLDAFVRSGPPTCATMTRATANGEKVELSGSESFRELVRPFNKALRYSQGLYKKDRSPAYPVMLLCIAVLDAPMVLIEDPETASDPVLSPWVRFERREPNPDKYAWTKTRFYGIDVVHADFLDTYVCKHLLPYIALFEERLGSHGPLLDGRGAIDTIDDYKWERLTVQSRAAGA
jgi:hypothetical protein